MISREARRDFDAVEQQGRYWAPRWLKPGRKVRVTEGPLAGFLGEVWRLTARRTVALFVFVLGGQKLVEVEIGCVARDAAPS